MLTVIQAMLFWAILSKSWQENRTGKPYKKGSLQRSASTTPISAQGTPMPGKNESFSYQYFGDWKQEIEPHLSIAYPC